MNVSIYYIYQFYSSQSWGSKRKIMTRKIGRRKGLWDIWSICQAPTSSSSTSCLGMWTSDFCKIFSNKFPKRSRTVVIMFLLDNDKYKIMPWICRILFHSLNEWRWIICISKSKHEVRRWWGPRFRWRPCRRPRTSSPWGSSRWRCQGGIGR